MERRGGGMLDAVLFQLRYLRFERGGLPFSEADTKNEVIPLLLLTIRTELRLVIEFFPTRF